MNEDQQRDRELLAAFVAQRPPADIGLRVQRIALRRRQRWVLCGAVTAIAACLTVVLVVVRSDPPTSGQLRQQRERTTLALADRATAVAEAGAMLSWSRDAQRTMRVQQTRGNVFYRVEPAGSFIVNTPTGTVRVVGTCFRVEVKAMSKKTIGNTALSAAAGAALSAIVVVSVYEGRVYSTPSGRDRGAEIKAGERAEMRADQPPRISDMADAERPRRVSTTARWQRGGAAVDTPQVELLAQNRALRQKAQQLASELQSLRQQLDIKPGEPPKSKMLNFSKEELVNMAKRCELRWDMPSHGSTPPTASSNHIKELGINEDERALINAVFARQHALLQKQLRALYVEATGDSKSVDELAPSALIAEIQDKSSRDEIRGIFRRLARERAGLVAVNPSRQQSTTERLMRLLTTNGDQVEQAMAAKIGPDLARRYRELGGGYGSHSRSSWGCPKN
ncbi:MAG: FecR domain-containing protein [Deltaproteobacteria bacterium]|nr:FecR domain-containing protein [Deltaproteobacteria bacterium]